MIADTLLDERGRPMSERRDQAMALREQGHSLAEIGKQMGGISRERVRQLLLPRKPKPQPSLHCAVCGSRLPDWPRNRKYCTPHNPYASSGRPRGRPRKCHEEAHLKAARPKWHPGMPDPFKRTNFVDLSGQRMPAPSRLTVIRDTGRRLRGSHVVWLCQCDCGGTAEVATANLRSGNTTSCGCVQREKSRGRRR